MALTDELLEQKQFDKALEICHFIFSPMDNRDPSKCWKFRLFQEIMAKDYLDNFFQSLIPNQGNSQITGRRNNPFAPHVVARSRTVAYMKATVMNNQIASHFPIGFTGKPDTLVDLPNIFRSATTRYFCLPNNPQLRALRDTIDDRLFYGK
ncbi:hypothetical protein EMGR_001017 [Emarellia grisea]